MNAIGLDIGTTTLSAVALNAESGQILEAASVQNDSALESSGFARCQNPERIWDAALGLLRDLKKRHAPVGAVGLTGQMHGMLYLNGRGEAVSPLYTWQDGRGDQVVGGETYVQRLSRLTGHALATGFGGVTHYWHCATNNVPEDALRFCTIADYVGMKLTGRTEPLTHASNAASFGLYDCEGAAFDRAAIEASGMQIGFFPRVTRGAALLGDDDDGARVAVAIGDNQASFIGSVREPGRAALINMGTGGQISLKADAKGPFAAIESRPLNEGDAILVGSSLCAGRAYALLEGFLRSCCELVAPQVGSLYPFMNALGERALGFTDKLTARTQFSGTRRDPALRGAVENIGEHNFTAAHLIGATIEGMVEELYQLYLEMRAAGAPEPEMLVGSGNAIRKNPALRKAFESRFGRPLAVPAHQEEAACGAALFALAAAGMRPSLAEAQALIQYL